MLLCTLLAIAVPPGDQCSEGVHGFEDQDASSFDELPGSQEEPDGTKIRRKKDCNTGRGRL